MSSKNIAFDSVPSSIRKPGDYVEFNLRRAATTLPGNIQRTLIIGQRLTSGSVAALTVVDIFSASDAATYFGYGSIAHLMCLAALTANNYLSLQCITLDDAGGGVAATALFTLTGTATNSGVLTVLVGNQSVQIAVSLGDTAAVIAGNLVTQFAAQPSLPYTAAAVAGVVTLTAKHKGTLGNAINTRFTLLSGVLPLPGITGALTVGVTGATDPTIATALAVVYGAGHNILIPAWNDVTSLTALRTHLGSVSSSIEQRGAIAATAQIGTLAAATTLATTLNEGRISCALLPSAFNNSYEVAAAYGAVMASEQDPARPLNSLPLAGILPNTVPNYLSRTMQETCLYNGITPLEVGPGQQVQIVRAISTYTLNALGAPDTALLDMNTIRTLDYVRLAIRTAILLQFPRSKLSVNTPAKVRTVIIAVLTLLEDLEIVQNVTANLPGIILELDIQDPNRLDAKIPANVVTGLHVFAARIDLIL